MKFVTEALQKKGYRVTYFTSGAEAVDYLDASLQDRTIGFGDSATMATLGLYERLSQHNTVYDPKQGKDHAEFLEIARKCHATELYFTSVNALAKTGELVNIDGIGNRIGGSLFGHKKVYFIVGTNKIEATLERAIWRARNIAAPQNAKRYQMNTPCALKGDRCYDCDSPDRICNAMVIHFRKVYDVEDVEIVLIEESLGF